MWGRCSLEAAASLLLELLRADWSSVHPESMAMQMYASLLFQLHV